MAGLRRIVFLLFFFKELFLHFAKSPKRILLTSVLLLLELIIYLRKLGKVSHRRQVVSLGGVVVI